MKIDKQQKAARTACGRRPTDFIPNRCDKADYCFKRSSMLGHIQWGSVTTML